MNKCIYLSTLWFFGAWLEPELEKPSLRLKLKSGLVSDSVLVHLLAAGQRRERGWRITT